jgi:hypothetical protein
MSLDIEKTLVVSTGNVLQSDMELLEVENSYPYTVHKTLYGVIVHIASEMMIPVDQSVEFITEGSYDELLVAFSRDFRRVLKLAQDNDCQWLNLDQDGTELEGFTVHDW